LSACSNHYLDILARPFDKPKMQIDDPLPIMNEPFAAQRQAFRDQGFTWYNKVNPQY
jgi:hypothetical protein